MAQTHCLGFPRIGAKRELKTALEAYWQGDSSRSDLTKCASELRARHWLLQQKLDFQCVGDFSLYDHVLDMSFLLGNTPLRVRENSADNLDPYFRLARGRARNDDTSVQIRAGEMTKWFDTNYHYIVPELNQHSSFSLHAEQLLQQISQAQALDLNFKPVILGPVSYLYLSKSTDQSDKLNQLPALLEVYQQLIDTLENNGVQWLQIDEPILTTELTEDWLNAITHSYCQLKPNRLKILLCTYFGQLKDNLALLASLPVAGIHLDAINNHQEVEFLNEHLDQQQILSLGVIDGRNVWKSDLNACIEFLAPLQAQLGERLWLAPNCSLLHVPVDLALELHLDEELKSCLAFASQKLDELRLIQQALNHDDEFINHALFDNANSLQKRRNSTRIHNPKVKQRVQSITAAMSRRLSHYQKRRPAQIKLPLFPTTTIGSFPQTTEIRRLRASFKNNRITSQQYQQRLQAEIANCISIQEELGLDVLVHGEAERNDMVEYFGEQLSGIATTEYAWVQSYGSRCVKPPIIYGDITRPKPITVDWIKYAQSLTQKPVKAMLTGPVTILNWCFVRDDQSRASTAQQLALAIRDEVLDLEKAKVQIIQIDEAALREGLPLRRSQHQHYLNWAVQAFKLAANGVQDHTQIHTHMCYSEFNNMIESIADMDADVITIESARSHEKLLNVFKQFSYPNEIGPGVYDIHSPNIPNQEAIISIMQQVLKRLPAQRLWVNPDCGLKTRAWPETLAALTNMVKAAKYLRKTNSLINSTPELAN